MAAKIGAFRRGRVGGRGFACTIGNEKDCCLGLPKGLLGQGTIELARQFLPLDFVNFKLESNFDLKKN